MNDNKVQNNTIADDQQLVEQNGGLDDLRLTAEELDGIKGGDGSQFHKDDTPPEPPTGTGMFINNHNETVESDEDEQDIKLIDLEPVEEVKGGSYYNVQMPLSMGKPVHDWIE